MSDLPKIEVRFPSRRSVLASSRADGAELSLFVPTPVSVAAGERVLLVCGFADGDRQFELGGRVVYQRIGRAGMEQGLGVQFLDSGDKRAAAEMLAFCAGRAVDQGTAGFPRTQTSIRCLVRVRGNKFPAEVRDLSAAGAFVASAPLSNLKSGTEVQLQLTPGLFGLGGVVLAARLIWSGKKNGRVGFGARFIGDPAVVRPALKKYLGPRS